MKLKFNPIFKAPFILIIMLCAAHFAMAQYSAPNSVAFDAKTNNYYISNTSSGTVTKLDASFKASTVITGLTKPKGIFFIVVGTNEFLIILDSNKVRLYNPSTYQLFQSITVTGVTELEDAIVNPANPEVFYLSDRGGNKIIRGEVGPAPFYFPSFSDLSTGISKPSGLWIDSKGRMLMVQDTLNSPISAVDTTTGSVTSLKSTDIDNMNAITQDFEGNYYITNWGDDYLYRFTPDFSDSIRISKFNNPAGFYFNKNDDLLVMACSGCNKIEFFKLHNFIPSGNVAGCPGDSITVLMNGLYKSTGTFNSSNKFLIEASDALGSFNNATVVGEIASQVNPTEIEGKIPSDWTISRKFRIRSTSPVFTSPEYELVVHPTPQAFAYEYQEVGICLNSSITLGVSARKDYSYSWTPGDNLNDTTLSNPTYSSSSSGSETLYLKVVDTRYGCVGFDTVTVTTDPQLTLPQLADTVEMCKGSSIQIGVNNSDYSFKWTPDFLLNNDTISNPETSITSDLSYQVEFEDTQGCKGIDTVYVRVNNLPITPDISDSFWTCAGTPVNMVGEPAFGDTYEWFPNEYIDTNKGLTVNFQAELPKTYIYEVVATNSDGCSSVKRIKVTNNPTPELSITLLQPSPDTLRIIWSDASGTSTGDIVFMDKILNSTIFLTGESEGAIEFAKSDLPSNVVNPDGSIELEYYVVATNEFGCVSQTEPIPFFITSAPSLEGINGMRIYPNPAATTLSLEASDQIRKMSIYSSDGRLIRVIENNVYAPVDISDLKSGIYTVEITSISGSNGYLKFVKP